MSAHTSTLRITSHDVIPPDILVEHIAYALRTGLQLSGPFNVEVTTDDGYAQRHVTYEGEVR